MVGQIVVGDGAAIDLVAQQRPPVAAQLRALAQLDGVAAPVVFNGFAFAFNVFFRLACGNVAFLAEEGALPRFSGDGGRLVAFGRLAHLQAGTAQHDGAFGHHHPAREYRGLL